MRRFSALYRFYLHLAFMDMRIYFCLLENLIDIIHADSSPFNLDQVVN